MEKSELNHLRNLGNECFEKLKELNPSGGIKEFIRMSVEFGYKKAKNELFSEEDVKKAISYGQNYTRMDRGEIPYVTEEDFIKSLK